MASMSVNCVGQTRAFVQAPCVVAARPAALQVVCSKNTKADARRSKHMRIRNKISGTEERPRLCVFRSNKQMYAQIVDDTKGITLCAASTLSKDVKESLAGATGGNQSAAEMVGKKIAEVAAAAGVTKVCFDRAGYKYHGRVLAVATAARETGLEF